MKSSQQDLLLVVDDNEANRDVLSRRLKRQGHDVLAVENGRLALETLREKPFDLVLLDIMMPEMNGYQVLEEIKADSALRHIPVIMISAVDDMDSVVRCIELGAEDYLFKPFNPVLLRARVSASLEKKRLRDQEQAYLTAVKQELELGRRMQADFLPEHLPQLADWEIVASFHPAREVAGDFYDAFPLDDGRVALVLADVCDKGVGAALFMVLVRSLIRAFAEQSASMNLNPMGVVQLANDYITRHHHNNKSHLFMFATLFLGVLEPETGLMTYVNGGHEPPAIINVHGVKTVLDPTGPAVGLMPDSRFSFQQVQFAHGDILVAYTDGVTEARSPTNEMFGEERMIALLENPISSASDALQRIEAAVRQHMADRLASDDITMLAVQRKLQ